MSEGKDGLVKRELTQAGKKLVEEAQVISAQIKEGGISGAYLYPLRGIFYLATHRSMLAVAAPAIRKSIIVSGVVVSLMFLFTYLPQVALLAFVSGPLAFIAAVPAVLAESYVIITFVTKNYILRSVSTKLFDAVLLERGHEELTARGRSIRIAGVGAGAVRTLGRTIINPVSSRFSTEGMLRYILSIPLNAIPAIGTVLFLVLNGENTGPAYHSRYFQLKGLKGKEKAEFISERHGAYTSFGIVALGLGFIPIVGIAFILSSTVGAAIWASDLENESKGKFETKVGDLSGTGIRVEMGNEL